MSLRFRLLITTTLTLVALIAGVIEISSRIMERSFLELEQGDVLDNLSRAKRAISQMVEETHAKTSDWAFWDDTYEFAKDRDPAYVKSNLSEEPISMMKLDLLMLIDLKGQVIASLATHRTKELRAVNAQEVLGVLNLGKPSATKVGRQGKTGLVRTKQGPLIFSARPILTSQIQGPPRGWLVFGRYLAESEHTQLRRLTQMKLDLTKLRPGQSAAEQRVTKADNYLIATDTIADTHGKPILNLAVSIPRRIYAEGRRSIDFVTSLTICAGLIFGIVIFTALEFFALSRLTRLTRDVSHLPHILVRDSGHDELGVLGRSINEMAERVRQTEGILRQQNDHLEQAVTDRTREIEYQSLHDKLTGLANRDLFSRHLGEALAKAKWTSLGIAILFVDLDNFKIVNDSLGHAAGDELLVSVGKRLADSVRPGDIVARFGGDEFAILLENLNSVNEAEDVARRILHQLKAPTTIQNHEAFACASIGIAYSKGTAKGDVLLKQADLAMYRAKANGKFGFAIFDQSMSVEARKRLELETALRRAVDQDAIHVQYQPIVDLQSGESIGAEALARWTLEGTGDISPSVFIPIAEDIGVIDAIGYRVMELACHQASDWIAQDPSREFTISVNLSGRQLMRDNIVEQVLDILEKTGLHPTRLKLEITETILLADRPSVTRKMNQLKAMGIRLALDDFGTGYSSLSTLSSFPIDTLKIDRGFISTLGEDREPVAIVKAIMALSRTLKMDVTAEGLETQHQVQVLRTLGCRHGQGYFFYRPLSAEEFGQAMLESKDAHRKAA